MTKCHKDKNGSQIYCDDYLIMFESMPITLSKITVCPCCGESLCPCEDQCAEECQLCRDGDSSR